MQITHLVFSQYLNSAQSHHVEVRRYLALGRDLDACIVRAVAGVAVSIRSTSISIPQVGVGL